MKKKNQSPKKINLANVEVIDESIKKSSLRRKVKSIEIGDSGTEIYQGIIYDEYNSKLRDTQGINIYDEMRRSDGTIKSVLLATSLPIRRAKWFVEPASQDDIDIEIADFINKAIFELPETEWEDTLRQALLCLPFGVMVFEKVFDIRNVDGVDRVIWKKFAPRLPKSIQAWQTSTGLSGIQQRTFKGDIVDIEIEKLLIFVNEKEGDNWWGNSILRPAYKHWHIKNTLYKIDAIAAERQGLGVPYAKMPAQYTEEERSKAETILKNLRANEQAFIIEPSEYEIGFKDMMAHTTRDLTPSIQHHNREITKSVLAQFLELGSTDSGSRALSTDQTELFLQSLEAVANNICGVFNTFAIKQLVDLNFSNVERYPKLNAIGISKIDTQKLASTYKTLTESNGIVADKADEQFFRETLGLPEKTEEMVDDIDTEIDDLDILDDLEMSDLKSNVKKKIYPTKKIIKDRINASIANLSSGHKLALLKRSVGEINNISEKYKNNNFFSSLMCELETSLKENKKIALEEGETFKGYRPMTFAEKKVNFDSIEKNLDRLESTFDKKTQDLLNLEREKYINSLNKAINNGDKEAIKRATFKIQDEYYRIIKESMKDSYEYGKNNAALEINKTAPVNAREILNQIDIQAYSLAEMHITEITNSAKTAIVESLNKGESKASAVAVADAVVAKRIIDVTTNTSRIAMAAYVNYGRYSVFDKYVDNVYALQRSELLDYRTCNYCLSVDGRVIDKKDSFGKNTIFHSNCRGIWVAIMLDEAELPKIGGVPKSVRDRFGDSVNDLIQPKSATTNKDSEARKEQERRLKREAKRKNGDA